jgi:hypothetical protein
MDPENGKNFLVLGAVVGLIALCLLVLHFYSKNLATERCIEEGRRNCVPLQGINQ